MNRANLRKQAWRPLRIEIVELLEDAASDGRLPIVPCETCGGSGARPRLELGEAGVSVSFTCPACREDEPHLPAPALENRVRVLEGTVQTLEAELCALRALLYGPIPAKNTLLLDRNGRHHSPHQKRTPTEDAK